MSDEDDLEPAQPLPTGEARPREAPRVPDVTPAGDAVEVRARDQAGLRQEDVAQIVHDLRNPLATIALEAFLLDAVLADAADTETKRAIERIARNVSFLDRMVQDLLDLCSIDAGRFAMHRVPTELRALLQGALERVVSTRDRGRVSLEAPDPVTMVVDNLRIERVVANLVQNALKYAPALSGVVVRLDVNAERTCISVTDAGPGMTPHELTYIFDKYRRTPTAHIHDGCGLGLYVSKKIVEAHGGRIGVESRRGAGSTFHFELPPARAREARASSPDQPLQLSPEPTAREARASSPDQPLQLSPERTNP